jgi:hypothetical protein
MGGNTVAHISDRGRFLMEAVSAAPAASHWNIWSVYCALMSFRSMVSNTCARSYYLSCLVRRLCRPSKQLGLTQSSRSSSIGMTFYRGRRSMLTYIRVPRHKIFQRPISMYRRYRCFGALTVWSLRVAIAASSALAHEVYTAFDFVSSRSLMISSGFLLSFKQRNLIDMLWVGVECSAMHVCVCFMMGVASFDTR